MGVFIAHHPSGFYADLARAQVNRLVAAQQSQAMADHAQRDAEAQAAQKAEKLQKRLEQPATSESAAAKQQILEQSKELEEAKKQVELAQQRAEAARQEVEQAKRQAVEEAQGRVEEAKGAAKEDAKKVATLTPGQTDQPAAAQIGPGRSRTAAASPFEARRLQLGKNRRRLGRELAARA